MKVIGLILGVLVVNSILGYLMGLLCLYVWKNGGADYLRGFRNTTFWKELVCFILWPVSTLEQKEASIVIYELMPIREQSGAKKYLNMLTIFGPIPKIICNLILLFAIILHISIHIIDRYIIKPIFRFIFGLVLRFIDIIDVIIYKPKWL